MLKMETADMEMRNWETANMEMGSFETGGSIK
jgi:hypothetical protein